MSEQPDPPEAPAPVRGLELKASLLIAFSVLLLIGSALYLMAARGVFEASQRLVLTAEDPEGVVPGMDLTFSGFAIGRVRRVELDEQGNARILVDVASRDAHWLRQSTVFTMVRGMLGGTKLRAHSPSLTDAPLADGAVRPVYLGDATGDIPRLVTTAQELLQNLASLSAPDSPLQATLKQLQALSERVNGPQGALGAVMGSDRERVIAALDRSNALLARADSLLAHADAQLLGDQGVVPASRAAVQQLTGLLQQAQNSLKGVDAVLQEAQAVAANARVASNDLGTLRADVETSLRRVEGLVNEINRKWPFARDTEVRLP